MPRFGLALLGALVISIPAVAGAGNDPLGACCIPPSYQCFITTHVQCDAWGGMWIGDGTVCEPHP